MIHNNSIDNVYTQKAKHDAPCPIVKMRVNAMSTIFGPVGRVINTRSGSDYT